MFRTNFLVLVVEVAVYPFA